jgi:hypothetical protein
VKKENGITLEYFNLRTDAAILISKQLPEDDQGRPNM